MPRPGSVIWYVYKAFGMKLWKLWFPPLTCLSQREVLDFYVLPYEATTQSLGRLQVCYILWKLSFASVSGYKHSLSGFLTFFGQPNHLEAGEQTLKKKMTKQCSQSQILKSSFSVVPFTYLWGIERQRTPLINYLVERVGNCGSSRNSGGIGGGCSSFRILGALNH